MNCKIVGYEYKTLEVVLSPGESFYAERGSIVYVDEALQREAEWNERARQPYWRCVALSLVGRVGADNTFL